MILYQIIFIFCDLLYAQARFQTQFVFLRVNSFLLKRRYAPMGVFGVFFQMSFYGICSVLCRQAIEIVVLIVC